MVEPQTEAPVSTRINGNSFAVMLFRPDSVDLVDLATDRRSRSVRTGRDEWVEQRTVP